MGAVDCVSEAVIANLSTFVALLFLLKFASNMNAALIQSGLLKSCAANIIEDVAKIAVANGITCCEDEAVEEAFCHTLFEEWDLNVVGVQVGLAHKAAIRKLIWESKSKQQRPRHVPN